MDFDFSKIEGFEWDDGNLKHIKKHDVNYKECEELFSNKPFLLSYDKIHSLAEDRFQALGQTNYGRLIFLVFTVRKNKVRVISARDQNRKEEKSISKVGGETGEKIKKT